MLKQLEKWEAHQERMRVEAETKTDKRFVKPPVAIGSNVTIMLHWDNGTSCLASDTFHVDQFVFRHGPPNKMVLKEHPEMDGIPYEK